jgi:DNA-binding transcriptional LysR family regulator
LGAAFVSVSAIAKELQMGILHRAAIDGVVVKRTLWVIFNPNRYRSKAADAFIREILPQFTTPGWGKEILESPRIVKDALEAVTPDPEEG